MENGVRDGTQEKPSIKMWAEEEDTANRTKKKRFKEGNRSQVTGAEDNFKNEGLLNE